MADHYNPSTPGERDTGRNSQASRPREPLVFRYKVTSGSPFETTAWHFKVPLTVKLKQTECYTRPSVRLCLRLNTCRHRPSASITLISSYRRNLVSRILAMMMWLLTTIASLPWVRELMLLHPASKAVKIDTLVVVAEIRTRTQRCRRVERYKQWRRISMAHEAQAKRFDAVVYMHAGLDVAGCNVRQSVDNIWMAEVPVSPGVLADEILRPHQR